MPTPDRETQQAFAADVAAALGPPWASGPTDEWGATRLAGHDGASLYLEPNGQRLTILGLYPSKPHVRTSPRINVTQARGAATIAAEIKRRLLPGYLPELAKALQAAREQAEEDRAARELADELATRFPGAVIHRNNDGTPHGIRLPRAGRWPDLISFTGDTVKVELNQLPRQALGPILAILSARPEA